MENLSYNVKNTNLFAIIKALGKYIYSKINIYIYLLLIMYFHLIFLNFIVFIIFYFSFF